MARFDPKKFDFKKSESDFLTKLSKATTADVAKQIEASQREINACRTQVQKLRDETDKKVKAAQKQLELAIKLGKALDKKAKTAQGMIKNIYKSPGPVGIGLTSKLQKVHFQMHSVKVQMSGAVISAGSMFGNSHQMKVETPSDGMMLAPSQTKILIGG